MADTLDILPEKDLALTFRKTSQQLVEFFKPYLEHKSSGFLFPSRTSKTGHYMSIQKPFTRVVNAAALDVRQVDRHTLRHTAISHLVMAGVDLPTVQKISGHKTKEMIFRYAHQDKKHIGAALDALDQRIMPDTITPKLHNIRT